MQTVHFVAVLLLIGFSGQFLCCTNGFLDTLWDINIVPDIFKAIINDEQDLQTLNLLADASNVFFNPTNPNHLYSSYDYIIVGSGPAGCVLANRLSNNRQKRVLLIEAGNPESIMQQIPVAATLSANSKYTRTYDITHPNNVCKNIINGTCPYPIGEALGGSSVINYMVYTRGNRDDFDRWEAKAGKMWGYEESMKLYDEFERSTAFGKRPNIYGTLSVENAPFNTDLLKYYLKAGEEIAGRKPIDYNGPNQMGIGVTQGTSKNGKRMSAADGYIAGVFGSLFRGNLHVLTNSLVTKIIIDENTKTAKGVEFVTKGKQYKAYATSEVIISAGPFRSAQLLMVSGIGPKEHLMEKNVPFIHDLPVGEFFDHVALEAPTFIVNTTDQSLNFKKILPTDFLLYPLGHGITTMFLGLEALAFHKVSSSERPDYCPDLELLFMSGGIHSDFGVGFRKLARIQQGVYDEYFEPLESTAIDAWTSIILHLHPRTKGRISLRDNSIFTDPIIYYPFFDDEQDIEDILEGIKLIIQYSETKAMRSINSRIYKQLLPGCKDEDFGSDDYWRCYIRHMTTIMVHMVGTNRMGTKDDPEAVVDEECRVRGMRNLRVADTSVVPMSVSGHPQAFSYLIGERLAKLLTK